MESSVEQRLARWTERAVAIEPTIYALWAAACTLSSARMFYGYMLKQTRGEWSAPLDDVFIHFDYARATAEGHPFEWIAGNGYSSGNTSLTYPFVLALGYLAGFHGQRLMLWAAIVAATCVFGVLLAGRALFMPRSGRPGPLDRCTSYLLPPVLLGVGALDWSLWSGMEVSFFLATWALAFLAYLALVEAPRADVPRRAWTLGGCGLLLVMTRPEAITTIAVFGVGAGILLRQRLRGVALGAVLRAGTPGALGVAGQALINRVLTGEWTASGAIVKLAVYNPFLSRDDKIQDYLFNLKYQIFRNVEYHFADVPAFGILLPTLALASVAVKRTRAFGLLLLAQVAGWTLLVALNAQVRWQNERYTMPAVAWLLMAAALGASALVRRNGRDERPLPVLFFAAGALAVQAVVASLAPELRPTTTIAWTMSLGAGVVTAALLSFWPARIASACALLVLAYVHQAPNLRGQKWFFGRASRNILEQHVTAGRFLKKSGARRVLVGDAGALIYASERRGLDIIGLGGFRSLPFARAGIMGLSSTIELLEHLPPADRPDVFAIYPSWWGILPTWFAGEEIARFPAEGNVICGGYEDVLYRADWHLLGSGENARSIPLGLRVRDSVDIADLLSEADHDYHFNAPVSGWTDMKILPDPADERSDMLDGGRMLRPGSSERMRLGGLDPGRGAWLVVRSAPAGRADVVVRVAGKDLATLHWTPGERWVEENVEIPGASVTSDIDVELANRGPSEFVDFHVWVAE